MKKRTLIYFILLCCGTAQAQKILTLEQAIEQAVRIHNSEVALFNNTADVVTALCSSAVKPLLEEYVLTLGRMMKGNIDWSSQDTTRYQFVYA